MYRKAARTRRGSAGVAVAVVAAVLVVASVVAFLCLPNIRRGGDAAPTGGSGPSSLTRGGTPAPGDPVTARAKALVDGMTLEERVGQLVMAPLFAGDDPSVLEDAISGRHVGSVLVIGNWRGGVADVRRAVDTLQSYAPQGAGLIVATDQEGGQVQHLSGAGFDEMPSAVEQGRMDPARLRSSAAGWGGQLAQAGVNVDLAPVTDTVVGERSANDPIGALDRDFGLDAAGNASHAAAFVEGLRDAGVQASVKHYPGLGAVKGNTDFTAEGIVDTTTTADGAEISAFHTVIGQARPAMVMMSLATYQSIDAANPAAFSSTIIDGVLRGRQGFDGVVTSDSLSATAVSGTPTDQLGVRLVEAGGDLACIGQSGYVTPILDGLEAKAKADDAFAAKVARSAERVVRLKLRMGLMH
ncbi:glycoside hydrolase family 3 N-terminal domain-containing protein [Bifidobacterium platyrrhinorum]|uniref:glycoside hydrolase family 3 N-terminal domain-containing protein n=1 Tax=Bifidobacterium platyrrhinorum TaxID=2661628 RepID=UPI00298C1B63|nr:glycoside hydrolase family 3 N-terminal domain-containing protein [Bifidobacterium platyrrhinorum]